MSPEQVETLIVGGGQAGLAMSHRLGTRGRRHLVLERQRIAERWRSERWDGLRFQFPNWSVRLPDFPLPTAEPDAFATPGDIVDFLMAYATFIAAPVRCGVTVTAVRRGPGAADFLVETSQGPIAARNVVIATGPYQAPVIPSALAAGIELFQVHASRYGNPDQLPSGAVLVAGSGASGTQIAEELLRAGRRVYLSVGRHRRLPRRYRGRDLTWWLSALGLDQKTTEERGPNRTLPLITGAYGGHTIDLRQFAAQGITLMGRLDRIDAGVLQIAPDLGDSLAHGDAAYLAFLETADDHVERHGLDLPTEPGARAVLPDPACLLEPISHFDLRAAGVSAVIWATGYRSDFAWIDLPIIDGHGEPIHRGGVTEVPGLYFIGLPWLSKMNSSFLAGVGDDAERLAAHIAARTP